MRPRKRNNRNLPPNLYISKKGRKYYFRYRHPVTGKETGMGSDRSKAVRAANELNSKLMPPEVDLVARVIGGADRMDAWMKRYDELLGKRDLADTTRVLYKSLNKVIRESIGDIEIARVDTKIVAQFLEGHEHKPTMANQLRSRLKDIFNEAIMDGRITQNPVTATRSPKVKVVRSRLSLDDFNTILAVAETMNPRVSNSLLLALLTGQRLDDIANMQFSDIADGYLHVNQRKSGSLVRLSLKLRLNVMNMSISDVVSRCRDRVVSRYLIHHNKNGHRSRAGGAINKATISRGFMKARNLSNLSWDNPPSFHEIRSLSGRLYKKQGVDAQSLLGHKSAQTTELYVDVRGSEWISVG